MYENNIKFIHHKLSSSRKNYKLYKYFGLFGTVLYPLMFMLHNYTNPETFDPFLLRFICLLLCVGLITQDHWPLKIQPLYPSYTLVATFFLLPYFHTFLVLMNYGNTSYIFDMLVAIICLIHLCDWKKILLISFFGIALGAITYFFIAPTPYWPHISFDIIGLFILLIIVGSAIKYTFYDTSNLSRKSKRSMMVVAGNLAHELRTPLATILMASKNVQRQAQEAFKEKKTDEYFHLEIEKSLKKIIRTTNRSQKIINHLLLNVQDKNFTEILSPIDLQMSLKHALEDYPFQDGERDLVHIDPNIKNFTFMGTEEMFTNVIFNLLKNALYYIQKLDQGEIYISTSQNKNFHFLHFKDTGPGIAEEHLKHIFDVFYSTKSRHIGNGLGLSFCKDIMQQIKGDIECESVEGEFTLFRLQFPKLKHSTKK